MEAQYWDGWKWASAYSTQTISDNATRVAFTVGINAAADGSVDVKTKLRKYEASSGIWVDPKMVMSRQTRGSMSVVWLDGFPMDLEKLPIQVQWNQGLPRYAPCVMGRHYPACVLFLPTANTRHDAFF